MAINKKTEQTVRHDHTEKDILRVKNLSASFGKKKILKNINIDIKENTFLAILGKNGSGKTTLIRSILNFIKSSGDVYIHGKNKKDLSRKEISQKIAYVPQQLGNLEDVLVYDYIAFGRFPHGSSFSLKEKDKHVIEKTMNFLNIFDLKDKFISNLSGGQRQKVSIASSLVQETNIIILDEPTTYLDIYNQYEILEILYKLHREGKTVIAILHDMNHALKYSDKALILNDGKVYDYGDPEKIINAKSMKDAFNVKPTFKVIHKIKHLIDIDVDEIRKDLKEYEI